MQSKWVGILVLLILQPSLFAEVDESSIRDALKRAKEYYASESQKLQEAISDSIERRLATARKAGNKKLVDTVELERSAFDDCGEIPAATPVALRRKSASLDAAIEKAYSTAIRDYVRANRDGEAEAVETDQAAFRRKLAIRHTREMLIGTWRMEMTGYRSDLTFSPDGTFFQSTEKFTAPWKIDREKQCIKVYRPGASPDDEVTQISLPLDPNGTKGVSWTGPEFTLTKLK